MRSKCSARSLPAWLESTSIDPRVRGLVAALNDIPGVSTFSSCGGHRHPTSAQVGPTQFYVELIIDRTHKGWRAIDLLLDATDYFLEDVTLTPWKNGEGACWQLKGRRMSPNELADFLDSQVGI